jgi:hypothetical protein
LFEKQVMAVALEGYTVVGLKSRIDEKFAGGVEALTQAAPNQMVLADDDLWRCSFMVCAEAERFVESLASSDLNGSTGPDPDLVIVNEFDLSVSPYCEWLEVGPDRSRGPRTGGRLSGVRKGR